MSKVAAAPDSPVMTVRVAARLAEQRGESMAQLPTTGLRAIADAFTGTVEALEDLVRINEEHNAAVEAVIGRPLGWKDSYLDRARAALEKAGWEG